MDAIIILKVMGAVLVIIFLALMGALLFND
jgi:hypothetical protein